MIEIEEITSRDQFDKLRPAWEQLIEEDGALPPFLTHEWFDCCLTAYHKEIFTLAVKDGSHVRCIAPFWRYQDLFRGIQVRKIEFITSPDSPFADFIVGKEGREEILRALIQYLFTLRKGEWDLLTLNGLQADSQNYALLKKILQDQKKKSFEQSFSMTPYISIEGEWEAFLQTRSVRFKKTRRNIINRLTKLGKVEIQCFQEDIDGAVFNEILAISERSWKQKEGIAISSREEFKKFFKNLSILAGQKGWLKVWLLKVDKIPIAMEYDLEHAGKVYALRADFDEAYKEYSPGSYLEYQIVKLLFEEGCIEYNTGPGLNTYKLHWTEKMKENLSFQVCNNNLKGLMIWALEKRLIPLLKRVRDLKRESN